MGEPFEIPAERPLAEQVGETFPQLGKMVRRLLAPDGCPWDREQSLSSLRKYILEEACEVMDALESGDRENLREELGDLAFQLVFLTELAQREGAFGPDDVFRDVLTKLVRRHPHVFADDQSLTTEEVEINWEKIKAEEKKGRPLLDNIARALPALECARRLSERVATVGFDWKDEVGSRAKVAEELAELDEAVAQQDQGAIEHELGDLLFSLVNFGRHLGVDPEDALRKTTHRFRTRFQHVESRVREKFGDWPRHEGKATRGVPLDALEAYWASAKELERNV